MKIIRQRDWKDCGVCALESIIEHYGGKVSIEQLRLDALVSEEGTTALNLILTAQKYGFDALGVKLNDLDEIKYLPAIAHMNLLNGGNHYVVIYKITKTKVILMDPKKGRVVKSKKDFYDEWTKVILLFYPRQKIVVLKKENTLLSIFYKTLVSEKKLVTIIILISILLTLFTIGGSYYFQVMGNAISNNWDLSFLKILVIAFGGMVVFKLFFTYLRGYYENHLNKNIDCIINADFLKHLYTLPLEVLTSRSTGEIVTRVNELTNIKSLVTDLFISATLDFGLMFVALPLLIRINSNLFFILFIALLLYFLIGILSSKVIYKKAYQNIEYEAEFNNVLIEDMQMINSIKNLNITHGRLENLERTLSKFLYDSYLFNSFLHKDKTIKNIISEICLFIIDSWGFYLILNNRLSIVELITFNALLGLFFDPLKNIIDSIPKYNFLKATITKINDFLSVNPEKMGTSDLLPNGNITFKNVSYSYNKFEYILKNLNFDISEGEVIFLKGKSGSGKSTICKMIDKYITDYEGEILIGGINIKDLSLKTIRENILYVNQQEALFSGSIKENILLDRNCDNILFDNISKICELEDIVAKKPLRFETQISNDAANISGGERQRIILARALLNDFKILVLDEALSEVDYNLERKIINKIKANYKDKTIIYVTHKNHDELCDRIIDTGGNYALL